MDFATPKGSCGCRLVCMALTYTHKLHTVVHSVEIYAVLANVNSDYTCAMFAVTVSEYLSMGKCCVMKFESQAVQMKRATRGSHLLCLLMIE